MQQTLIKVESIKLLKSRIFINTFIISILVAIGFFFIALGSYGDEVFISDLSTKMLSMGVYNLIIINVFLIAIIGSYIIGIEFENNNWCNYLTRVNKSDILKSKLIIILIISILMPIIIILMYMMLLKVLNYSLADINFNRIFIQNISMAFVLLFLGIAALILSFWGKNSLTGIVTIIGISMLEPIFYKYVDIKFILPMWNIKGFLYNIFDNLEFGDFLIIYPDDYLSPVVSFFILLVYLIILITIFIKKYKDFEVD